MYQFSLNNKLSFHTGDEKVNEEADDDEEEDENSVTNEEPSDLEIFSEALGLKRSENHK